METEHERSNAWLLKVLRTKTGPFCESMRERLTSTAIACLSPGIRTALRRIYGEHFGREGTEAYARSVATFDSLVAWSDPWGRQSTAPTVIAHMFQLTPEQEVKFAELSKAFRQSTDSGTVCAMIDMLHDQLMAKWRAKRKATKSRPPA